MKLTVDSTVVSKLLEAIKPPPRKWNLERALPIITVFVGALWTVFLFVRFDNNKAAFENRLRELDVHDREARNLQIERSLLVGRAINSDAERLADFRYSITNRSASRVVIRDVRVRVYVGDRVPGAYPNAGFAIADPPSIPDAIRWRQAVPSQIFQYDGEHQDGHGAGTLERNEAVSEHLLFDVTLRAGQWISIRADFHATVGDGVTRNYAIVEECRYGDPSGPGACVESTSRTSDGGVSP